MISLTGRSHGGGRGGSSFKIEWHQGEIFPRIGFIVTNLSARAEKVVRFYNQRGDCEQWITMGKSIMGREERWDFDVFAYLNLGRSMISGGAYGKCSIKRIGGNHER